MDDITSDADRAYDCAQAEDDLHRLLQERNALQTEESPDPAVQRQLNRLNHQIESIKNKCRIHP